MFVFSDKNEFQGRGEDISSNFSIFPTISLLSYLTVVVVGEEPIDTSATCMGNRTAARAPVSP